MDSVFVWTFDSLLFVVFVFVFGVLWGGYQIVYIVKKCKSKFKVAPDARKGI